MSSLWDWGFVERDSCQTLHPLHSSGVRTMLCSHGQKVMRDGLWQTMSWWVFCQPIGYTFLSTVSRYQVTVRHVAGAAILPSDHSSRNAPEGIEPNCQICSFVTQSIDSVVRNTFVSNILDGYEKLPFTTRSARLAIQPECSDLRRTCAHLRQGTRPSRKATNIKILNVISMFILLQLMDYWL